jgi:prepilin-type N-terminal cleavage/methylation domain-containing protein
MVPSPTFDRTVQSRSGFTLIELLIVVVIIGILASIAIPRFSNTKEKAQVAKMRGDLRNLVTAQEAYSSDFLTYYGGAVPNPVLTYNPSPGVNITIVQSAAAGFSATATSPTAPGRTCAIFVGSVPAVAPATVEGAVACN